MRAVIQKVSGASVSVDDKVVGEIGAGLMVLLGVQKGDGEKDMEYMRQKIVNLRIFEDDDDKLNLSIQDVNGELMIVSQFTLLGDARKGRRPGFTEAEEPGRANEMYEELCASIDELGIKVAKGVFQTHMKVNIVNDGPVTILLDSRKAF